MRNIVLITIDSLRADHCSFLGYKRNTTPTLDRMARKGISFENAIVSGVPTAPSMFGIFTGDYPLIDSRDFNMTKWRNEFRFKTTLAQTLSKMGYCTIAFNLNPFASKYFGFNKGFFFFSDVVKYEEIKMLKSSSKFKKSIFGLKRIIKYGSPNIPWEMYYDQILELCERFNQPYFIWIFILDTHIPYLPPRRYRKWCKANLVQLLYQYWKLGKNNWISSERYDDIIDIYDDAILYADFFVKRLWKDLKDFDPIFIIHGDHGEGFGEHGFYEHPPELYEELIHVPLIIYNADINEKYDKPYSLLHLSKLIYKIALNGDKIDLNELIGETGNMVLSKVFDKGFRKISIRTKKWKFIFKENEDNELYDLESDPQEQNNIIDEEKEVAKFFEKLIKKHIRHEVELRRIRRFSSFKSKNFKNKEVNYK